MLCPTTVCHFLCRVPTYLGSNPFFLSRPLETVLLTLFLVEHTRALDGAVVGNHLGEISSKCGLTALNRRDVENLESLLREGPRQEQCA
jgi:hypothetical protein